MKGEMSSKKRECEICSSRLGDDYKGSCCKTCILEIHEAELDEFEE